jgi:hypothetical protein
MDSKRSSRYALLFVVLFVGGCTAMAGREPVVWTKPGAMPKELESDKRGCARRATSGAIFNSKGMLAAPAMVDQARFAACMRDLGYTRSRPGAREGAGGRRVCTRR